MNSTKLGMCACARTREYCVTKGCQKLEHSWRFSTEGRDKDKLRRVIDLRFPGDGQYKWRPISRWVRPERAIAEAWLLNMDYRHDIVEIEKFGEFSIETEGVP